jgi:hypothetical protein
VVAEPGRSAGLHRARPVWVVDEYLPLEGYSSDGFRDLCALIAHGFANHFGLEDPPYDGLDDWYREAEPHADEALAGARADAMQRAAEAPALPGRTAAQLLAEAPEQPDWILPGVIAERWAVKIAGREKHAGKGTTIFYLLSRIERGAETVFGPSKQMTSLIVTEEPMDSVREKVEAFGLERSRIVYGWELRGHPTWGDKVEAIVAFALAEGHGIIFVDNISRATGIEDEASPELARAVEFLADSAKAVGLALLVDHHHKKGRDSLENLSRGNTALAGAFDNNIEIVKVRNGGWLSRKRKLSSFGRMRATNWEKVIELTEDGRDYLVHDGDEDETEGADEEAGRLIFDRLKLTELATAHGGAVTARQFAEAINKSKDTAARRLDDLFAQGFAVKDESGRTHVWRPLIAAPDEIAASPHTQGDAAPTEV